MLHQNSLLVDFPSLATANCHFHTDISPILRDGIPFSCNCHFSVDVSPLLEGGFSFSGKCQFYTDIALKLNDGLSFSCNCYFYTDVSPKLIDYGVSFSFHLIDKAAKLHTGSKFQR
jgi:hypothetical protein